MQLFLRTFAKQANMAYTGHLPYIHKQQKQ